MTDWTYPEKNINLRGTKQIPQVDADRQAQTAAEIVRRLRTQPGVVLADEVGMGKTFVAFAVAAAVIHSTNGAKGPVLFLVPSHMLDKWRDDWQKFRDYCVLDSQLKKKLELKTLEHASDLLRERAKPNNERAPVLLMKLSAFTRRLQDPWFKLAIVHACFRAAALGSTVRRRFVKWAPKLLLAKAWFDQDIVDALLRRSISHWDSYLKKLGWNEEKRSTIPPLLARVSHHADLKPLIEVLRHNLPGHKGDVGKHTIVAARHAFNEELHKVYQGFLRNAMWHSPLVVLDEAHHLKNPQTKAHSLFADRQETEDCLGFLDDTFDRMLFLTATPFQLGHRELINVLSRFEAIAWEDGVKLSRLKDQYKEKLKALEHALDESQRLARRLDDLWGTLRAEDLTLDLAGQGYEAPSTPDDLVTEWWRLASEGKLLSDKARSVVTLVDEVRAKNKQAEELLRPWIIRHSKLRYFGNGAMEASYILRRMLYPGAAIDPQQQPLCESSESVPYHTGLAVSGDQALPFLLSIRAQNELARLNSTRRAYFAEGLSSSYEAFHHTARQGAGAVDEDDDVFDDANFAEQDQIERWYVDQIRRFVPGQKFGMQQASVHPKVAATVARTVDLWSRGEKVLIFVFYRQTASALRWHVSAALERRLLDIVREKLGGASVKDNEARSFLDRFVDRLRDADSPFFQKVRDELKLEIERQFSGSEIHGKQYQQLLSILLRYVRSFGFAARYFPFDDIEFRRAIGYRRQATVASVNALIESFDRCLFDTGRSPRRQIRAFLDFMRECAGRDVVDDSGSSSTELDQYLHALGRIQVGMRHTGNPGSENYLAGGRLLANVRSITGETLPEDRAIVMRAFNSPMFPEVLVASQILAEGVDLQRSCRMVIHHDLCWNPSTLEQRIGRVDRLGSLSAELGRPLHIFEPYLTATADEKMYRVVKDRERWFQVVMGEEFTLSEISTEKRAQRVPLPQSLASGLTYKLHVVEPDKMQ